MFLIEYKISSFHNGCIHKHEIVHAWDEKDALLTFYKNHLGNGEYRTCDLEIVEKIIHTLSIEEHMYVLNNVLNYDLYITGFYKNLEQVYVQEEKVEENA